MIGIAPQINGLSKKLERNITKPYPFLSGSLEIDS